MSKDKKLDIARIRGKYVEPAIFNANVLGIGFDQYNIFAKPSDFTPTLPCNFWRDKDGKIQHDMDFNQFVGGTEIYVNRDTGGDTTGNGSIGTPYKTIKKAVEIINASADGKYTIKVLSDSVFTREQGFVEATITNKQIAIVPQNASNKIKVTMSETNPIWTQEDNVYKTTRTSTYAIWDYLNTDENGIFLPYEVVSTLAECKAEVGTWFTDGTLVYVNPKNGLMPTTQTVGVGISITATWTLVGTTELYLKNVINYGTGGNNGWAITATPSSGHPTCKVVANGCSFIGGNLRDNPVGTGNAFAIIDIKDTYCFDCIAAYAKRDGFNYHYGGITPTYTREAFVLEYNCKGYEVGYKSPETNNNTTTAHEGINILRIGTKGNGKSIPLADVNGCYSICIDCHMENADSIAGTYYLGYAADTNGKAIIINCSSDDNSIGLNAEVDTLVYGFKGNVKNTGFQRIIK